MLDHTTDASSRGIDLLSGYARYLVSTIQHGVSSSSIDITSPQVFFTNPDSRRNSLGEEFFRSVNGGIRHGVDKAIILGSDDFLPDGSLRSEARQLLRHISDSPELAANAIESGQQFSAYAMSYLGNPDVMRPGSCVIILPIDNNVSDNTDSKLSFANSSRHFLSHNLLIPVSDLANEQIPGTPKDILLWFFHHEMDHCSHQGQFFEYESDSRAHEKYANELILGHAQDPELPHFIRATRSFGFMMHTEGEIYDTTVLAPINGRNRNSEKEIFDTILPEILQARERVHLEVFNRLGLNQDPFKRLQATLDSTMDVSSFYHEATEILNNREGREQDAIRILRENPVSAEAIEVFNRDMHIHGVRELIQNYRDNPDFTRIIGPVMYETARHMLERGEFSDIPHGEQVVGHFVDGAQRYARGFFGVDPSLVPVPLQLDRMNDLQRSPSVPVLHNDHLTP